MDPRASPSESTTHLQSIGDGWFFVARVVDWVPKGMLLIPFFENAFKHGNLENIADGWLKSQLSLKESSLHFRIENSVEPNMPKHITGGVGLENIRARLNLLYEGQHQLDISSSQTLFSVLLILPLHLPSLRMGVSEPVSTPESRTV